MAAEPDVLELLLPSASGEELGSARRLTTFFRLLADDARGAGGERVRVDAASATRELDRQRRERALSAIEDLLRHHLYAALSPDDWAWFGEPHVNHQRAWSRLEGLRLERPRVAVVPAPGEPPLGVVARLLECAAAFACEPLRLDAWRARTAWVAEEQGTGERGAEEGLLEVRRRASEAGLELLAAELGVDCAAAALDRGDPRTALQRLTDGDPAESPRALALIRWCRLLLGGEPGVERSPDGGPLPRSLGSLREEWPAALGALAGPAAPPRSPETDARELRPPRSRRELGASALVWLRFDGAVRPVHRDLAPGLADNQDLWLRAKDGAWTLQGKPEQRLLLTGSPVVLRRLPGDPPLRGTLGSPDRSSTLALALVPVPDPAGELAGWIHLEFEHFLVPSRERLVALGRAAAGPMLSGPVPAQARVETAELDEDDPVAEAFRALVGELGTKLRHRRWWGFVPEAGLAVCVAQGGEGLADGGSALGESVAERPGGGRALARALAAGGVVHFDEPDPRLSLHARAGSGLVLPALLRGRVTALLALESERRRDFRERDVERLAGLVAGRALELRLALLRRWHRVRHGHDLCLLRCGPGFAAFAERLVAAGRTATPVVLSGEPGSGRRTLARWLHFESAGDAPPGPLVPYAGGDPPDPGESSSLLVAGLERLGERDQARLPEWLSRSRSGNPRTPASRIGSPRIGSPRIGSPRIGPPRTGPPRTGSPPIWSPRILATVTGGLAAAVAAGSLDPELARLLGRVEFTVPALADRREEIPSRVLALLERFGAEEGLAPPNLDDTARALLWRQGWPGNLGELENAVYKLVLARPGEDLGAAEVEEILRAFGVELLRRLPSRHPRRVDLLAALTTTRRDSGRLNKTRAALYLGWDPDTLVSRMREQGVDEESLDEPRGWSPGLTEAPR